MGVGWLWLSSTRAQSGAQKVDPSFALLLLLLACYRGRFFISRKPNRRRSQNQSSTRAQPELNQNRTKTSSPKLESQPEKRDDSDADNGSHWKLSLFNWFSLSLEPTRFHIHLVGLALAPARTLGQADSFESPTGLVTSQPFGSVEHQTDIRRLNGAHSTARRTLFHAGRPPDIMSRALSISVPLQPQPQPRPQQTNSLAHFRV